MAQGKIIALFLANFFGFSVYFLGVMEIPTGWQRTVMFIIGVVFMSIKVIHGLLKLYEFILDLVKKKHYSMRKLKLHGIEEKDIRVQNPNSKVYSLNVNHQNRNINRAADSKR